MVVADVGVVEWLVPVDSGSSVSRRPEGRVRDFSLAGTCSFESSKPTEKVGVLVVISGCTSAGCGERGGGVSKSMLPKMTFWFAGRSYAGV